MGRGRGNLMIDYEVKYEGPLRRVLPETPYQPNAAYTTD